MALQLLFEWWSNPPQQEKLSRWPPSAASLVTLGYEGGGAAPFLAPRTPLGSQDSAFGEVLVSFFVLLCFSFFHYFL